MKTRGDHLIYGGFTTKGEARFEKGAQIPYFECAEYRSSGTSSHDEGGVGDPDVTAYTWYKRKLTAETANDTPDFATFDAVNSRVTLPPGEYHIEASAPAYNVDQHQTRLWDFTDGAMIMEGTSEFAAEGAAGSQTRSHIKGHFTLNQETVIQLEHIMAADQINNGFGVDSGFYIDNVYTHVQLWQIRDDS
jgi:hypothetical protein